MRDGLRKKVCTKGPRGWCAPRGKSLLGPMGGRRISGLVGTVCLRLTALLCSSRAHCVLYVPGLRFDRPHLRLLAEENLRWGLRQRLLSWAGCQVPTRPARVAPAQYPKPKPSEAGSVWKGGAREWSEKFPSGGFERNGLCDDARQRRKGQFTPDLTRRRKTGEPRRRREVTAGISEEEQTSRRGKPIINHSRQKERRSISTHPGGYIQ